MGIKKVKNGRDPQEKLDLAPWVTAGEEQQRSERVLAEGRDQVLHSKKIADPLQVIG